MMPQVLRCLWHEFKSWLHELPVWLWARLFTSLDPLISLFFFFLIIANLYLICSLRAGYLGDGFAVAISLSPQPLEVRTVIMSILQLGTWRLEEMPWLAEDHGASPSSPLCPYTCTSGCAMSSGFTKLTSESIANSVLRVCGNSWVWTRLKKRRMATLLCEWRPVFWICMLPFTLEGLWPSLDWASWLGHLCCPKVCICARGRCLFLAMASLCLELWGYLSTWLGATAWPFRVEFLCLPAPSTGLAQQCCSGNALGIKGRTSCVEDLLCARPVPDTLYVLSHLHAPGILGGRSHCSHFAEKKQTQLGFAFGPLGILDGIRTDARACVLMVCDEFLKL